MGIYMYLSEINRLNTCIFYSLKKDKFSWIIFSGVIFFLITEIIIISLTPFKVSPRHTMIILPSLLILLSYGFSLINNKKLKTVLISLFIGVNLFYLIFSSNSAFKMQRGGYKPLADIINNSDIKQDDFIIVWNRKEVLDKYVNTQLNILSLLKNFAYTSEVILNNETELNSYPVYKRKMLLRKYFSDRIIPFNTIYAMQVIYKHMKHKQKFIITTTRNFDEITPSMFSEIVNDDKKYSQMSYNDLLTVKALLDLKNLCYMQFHFIKRQQNGDFVILVFEKL